MSIAKKKIKAQTITVYPDRTPEHSRWDTICGGQLKVETPKGLIAPLELLIEAATEFPARNIMTVMNMSPIPALAVARLRPESAVTFFHLDFFNVNLARRLAEGNELTNVEAVCQSNLPLPGEAPDLILMHTSHSDEKGLLLEMLRQARLRLAPTGKLVITTTNNADRWLREQLERIFGKVSVPAKARKALVYSASNKAPITDEGRGKLEAQTFFVKTISVHFDGEKLEFDTCYGVFSGADLDDGSRALLEVMEPAEPPKRILDLGGGWGGMGLLAAKKFDPEKLTVIETNARAVAMAQRNAERFGMLERMDLRHEAKCESILDAEGCEAEHGAYDAAIANPPYGADQKVGHLFIEAAHKALRSGGELWVVSKQSRRIREWMIETFGSMEELRRRGYSIYHGIKDRQIEAAEPVGEE
jgi:16S rRNA (guanine1207-N2)-methyltransferase